MIDRDYEYRKAIVSRLPDRAILKLKMQEEEWLVSNAIEYSFEY